ncbi:MAG: hypothetical protein Q4D53_05150 [Leptotrichiaceae bacterium]|nr:hypothetical protein [Leptotrichiaceae bacterium]
MKKVLILIILIITVLSCTSEDAALWNEISRQRKERGHGCYRDPYSGNTHCGYKN